MDEYEYRVTSPYMACIFHVNARHRDLAIRKVKEDMRGDIDLRGRGRGWEAKRIGPFNADLEKPLPPTRGLFR